MSDRGIRDHLEWCRQRNLRPGTIRARRQALARMRLVLGPDLLAVTEQDLSDWQGTIHLSAATMAAYVAHASEFYRWAADRDLTERDLGRRLVRPRVPDNLPRPIDADDLRLAIAAASQRIRPMLVLAAWAGLRACEVAALQRSDVRDHEDVPMLLINGKGGKRRIVPMSLHVQAALRDYGMPTRGHLFPRQDGQAGGNTAGRISRMCNDHLHGMGIPDTFHSLRHLFGTMTYRECHDIRTVATLMGHSTVNTTQGYVAYSNSSAVQAIAALDVGMPTVSRPAPPRLVERLGA